MKPLVSTTPAAFEFLAVARPGLSPKPTGKPPSLMGCQEKIIPPRMPNQPLDVVKKKRCFAFFPGASFLAPIFAAQVFWTGIAVAECGPFEDESRTTYRQLHCADFRGPRSANNAAYIRTSIRVNWTDVSVESEGDKWVAKFAAVCVQAFMLKGVSGLLKNECRADYLTHEQHHFEITQSYAESLGFVLEGLEVRASTALDASRGLLERTKTEYAGTVTRWKIMNLTYDRVTANGAMEISPERMVALLPGRNREFDSLVDRDRWLAVAH
jgi:hypothetical protein